MNYEYVEDVVSALDKGDITKFDIISSIKSDGLIRRKMKCVDYKDFIKLMDKIKVNDYITGSLSSVIPENYPEDVMVKKIKTVVVNNEYDEYNHIHYE